MKSRLFLSIIGVLAFLVLSVFWIGDSPWINDEPLLFLKVLEAKHLGRWWVMGLKGSTGIDYGPVPSWFYRIALSLTYHPVAIAAGKALITSGVTFAGIALSLRVLALPWQWALCLALSPYLYFYNRFLWDNVFLIPLSSLFLYVGLRLFKWGRLRDFILSLVLAWFLIHTHLMAAGLLVPFYWLVLREGAWKNWKVRGAMAALIALIAVLPYASQVVEGLMKPHASNATPWMAVVVAMPFFPRFFSFAGFIDYFFPSLREIGGVGQVLYYTALVFSLFPFVVFWVGLWEGLRGHQSQLKVLAHWTVGVLSMCVLFPVIMKVHSHPHYLNAMWAFAFFFIVFGVQRIWKFKPARALFALYVAAQVGMLSYWVLQVHWRGGDRGVHYGATLANQWEVMKELESTPSDLIAWNVENYRYFPWSWQTLRKLVALEYRHPPPDSVVTNAAGVVEYRDAAGTGFIRYRTFP